MSDYSEGNILVAGEIRTAQVPLVADTYYQGMPLKYEVDGTAAYVGTGNGTMTAITAGPEAAAGDWTFTFTAALLGYLSDPSGNIVGYFSIVDGGAATISAGGLTFTITDGATAFAATGVWTITIPATGKYEYTTGIPDAIYNGDDARVLSSAGIGSVILGGEIYEAGVVNDSGTAITFTEATLAAYARAGFFVKEK